MGVLVWHLSQFSGLIVIQLCMQLRHPRALFVATWLLAFRLRKALAPTVCLFSVFRWIVFTDYPCRPHACYPPLDSFSKRDVQAGTGDHGGSEQLLPQHQRGVSPQQLLQQQSWWLLSRDRWYSGALQVHPWEAVCHVVSCCRIRTQRHHQRQAASRSGIIHCFPHDVCGVTDLTIKSIQFRELSLFSSIFFKISNRNINKSFCVRVFVLSDVCCPELA